MVSSFFKYLFIGIKDKKIKLNNLKNKHSNLKNKHNNLKNKNDFFYIIQYLLLFFSYEYL